MLCDVDEKGKIDANALSMANVGGVFVVLAVGLLLSVIVAVVEFVWNERRQRLAVDVSKVDCLHRLLGIGFDWHFDVVENNQNISYNRGLLSNNTKICMSVAAMLSAEAGIR